MKKLRFGAALLVCAIMLTALASCGKPYNYDLSEYITLANYKGVEIAAAEIDSQVQSQLDSLLEQKATTEDITDRPAALGDIVNIDYSGTVDSVAFEGGTAAGQDVTLGAGGYIDGFEDGIVGMMIGEEKKVPCAFPEDYHNTELAGKVAEFTITLNSIKYKNLPELNDAFIVSLENGYDTLDSYKTYLRKAIKENNVWTKIVSETAVIKYPEKEVKASYNQMVTYYKSLAAQYNATLDEYIMNYQGSDTNTFLSYVTSYAKEAVKSEMCLNAIARAENITVSDSDYQTKGAELAKQNGMEDLKAYEKSMGRENIENSILNILVREWCAAQAVETAAEG
ncbi:MAG TPA: trigger factor [Clostridiales bacterium]|jgi:trigger factor|nr:trigger factor [Clostridiales bacterium]